MTLNFSEFANDQSNFNLSQYNNDVDRFNADVDNYNNENEAELTDDTARKLRIHFVEFNFYLNFNLSEHVFNIMMNYF